MRNAVTAYIGLGANLGDAKQAVRDGIAAIAQLSSTAVTGQSSLYRTAPLDAGGPDYINAVVEISTRLSAPDLLDDLQRLERAAGRTRPYRNAPRTLDLDLLLYGQGRIDSPRLQVPHPRMYLRAFVLVPLVEIAPHLVRPAQLAPLAAQHLTRL